MKDKQLIVFDTETTGLPLAEGVPVAKQPKIIEFAGIKLDHQSLEEVDRIDFLSNPGSDLPPKITEITGITDDDLVGKPYFSDVYDDLCKFFLGTEEMVAHNLEFDRKLLKFELTRLGRVMNFPWPMKHTCTVEISHPIKGRRLKNVELYHMATGKELQNAHRAMNDVEALCDSLRWLRKEGYYP